MDSGKKRRRNTVAVKLDLLEAVGTILKEQGFSKLGITLVAEEAGVDKTVIYRNFKNFDNLLEAYVEKQDFWLRGLKEYGENKIENKREFLKKLLVEQFNTIYSSKEQQQLLIWGLAEKGSYASSTSLKREILSEKLNKQHEALLNDYGVNFNFLPALMISGIYYLILNKDNSTFCGTDICIKKERGGFVKALEWLIDSIFDKIEKKSEVEQIAINAHNEGIGMKTIAKITKLSENKIKELVKEL